MAWTCSAATNDGLVQALHREGIVKTALVKSTMLAIDRKLFLPNDASLRACAYEDRPLPIGHNVTISAPHMHAMMLELLAPFPKPKEAGQPLRVLDVGSGSGYLTVALAHICETNCAGLPDPNAWKVIGLEHVPQLKAHGEAAAKQHFKKWIDSKQLEFFVGDGRSPKEFLGALAPDESFDAIHVGAAAYELHDSLLKLLRKGGAMVIPVGSQQDAQALLVCEKDANGKILTTQDSLCRFVPLTSIDEQMNNY